MISISCNDLKVSAIEQSNMVHAAIATYLTKVLKSHPKQLIAVEKAHVQTD